MVDEDARLANEEIIYRYRKTLGHHSWEIAPLVYSEYPSGEPLVIQSIEERSRAVDVILLRQKSMKAFLAVLAWTDALIHRGREAPTLIIPQFPGARQDRINDSGDYLFTAKTFAEMVNARNFKKVILVDPHSDVTPALIERSVVLPPEFNFGENYIGIISPDAGAEKRASTVAKNSGLPHYHAWKTRDVRTGQISGFGAEPTPPGHYLIVDDLCDGGGTFVGLAQVLAKREGVTADLYVTHGLFTKGTEHLKQHFKRILTTDSTVNEKPGVQIIPVCQALLHSI